MSVTVKLILNIEHFLGFGLKVPQNIDLAKHSRE